MIVDYNFFSTLLFGMRIFPFLLVRFINIHTYAHKKRGLFACSFDLLRFSTTLVIQIYARRTHADT